MLSEVVRGHLLGLQIQPVLVEACHSSISGRGLLLGPCPVDIISDPHRDIHSDPLLAAVHLRSLLYLLYLPQLLQTLYVRRPLPRLLSY